MATDIGIDLGSSKTVIFSSSKVVLELPNVVTVDSETWEPVYYGEKAKQTIGRTPESLVCVTPIERGVISDYDIAELMLKNYMQQAFGNRILRPAHNGDSSCGAYGAAAPFAFKCYGIRGRQKCFGNRGAACDSVRLGT